MEKKYILSESVAGMKLQRLAFEIAENNAGETHMILAGIRENGSIIAAHLATMLREIAEVQIDLIHLAMNKKHPESISLSHQMDFNDKVVLIVDDVTNSGKTLLYAIKPFLEYYPKKIQTLVLVERTHKIYPVHPDYVGISLATTLTDHIYVEVLNDKVMGAWVQ